MVGCNCTCTHALVNTLHNCILAYSGCIIYIVLIFIIIIMQCYVHQCTVCQKSLEDGIYLTIQRNSLNAFVKHQMLHYVRTKSSEYTDYLMDPMHFSVSAGFSEDDAKQYKIVKDRFDNHYQNNTSI